MQDKQRLISVDRNGTKTYESDFCPRCGGTGHLWGYEHVDGGMCFKCGGSGRFTHRWREYTPEYAEKLASRRGRAARKRFLKKHHFAEDGAAWLVLGDTFPIKDDLKSAGGHFDGTLVGWYFDRDVSELFPCAKFSVEDVFDCSSHGEPLRYKDPDALDAWRDAIDPRPVTGEFVGEIGERLTLDSVLESVHGYEKFFGGKPQWTSVYVFASGNARLVWKTQSFPELERGHAYRLTGTVKSHDMWNGLRETVLLRCRFEEI